MARQRYLRWKAKNPGRRPTKVERFVREYKESNPCADCQTHFPYYVLHLDHLPQFEKKAAISDLVASNASMEDVKAEIEKCEVVCANCHAVRTWQRSRVAL